MKQVFGMAIAIIAFFFILILARNTCNYTRTARVFVDDNERQFLIDTYGDVWEVLDELPAGAEVEITLREGGVLGECFDDIAVNVEVINEPEETETVSETVIPPLDID